MIERYQDSLIAAIFSESSTLQRWMNVELWALASQVEHWRVPLAIEDIDKFAEDWQVSPDFVSAVREEERTTRHDVAAFVACLERRLPPNVGRWVHYGLTSSDVVDTADAIAYQEALLHVAVACRDLSNVIRFNLVEPFTGVPSVARTHGQAAAPTNWSHQWSVRSAVAARVSTAITNLVANRGIEAKIGGPVGDSIPIEVASDVAWGVGLTHTSHYHTQVTHRQSHMRVAFALLDAVTVAEDVATQVRLLAHDGVEEVSEGRAGGQQGSSSMPHKSNPIHSERVCGLARVARGNFQAVAETVALWGHRDISNSSVERTAMVDLFHLAAHTVKTMTKVAEDLRVSRSQIAANLERNQDKMYATETMERLLRETDLSRQECWRIASSQ